ncbi:TNF receptor-associated factor 6-like isoform X5 [Dermacentor albipictus]|uniref:TNF receptor-associated factor 6-like isoform X5 n=1 Tax=Dermacentor albipictus TaxID=60249 RepID=UPI0038FBED9E
MRVDVQYRDLPGGTHKLRFADELPRHVMCGTCGMLSMQMYEDEQGHAFCNACVCLGSPAPAIFCKYENRNVPVDQLIEAFDIIQVIKDQVVFCPNEEKGCPVYTPLCRIEDHYLQCEKTEIECLQCQQRIKGCDWKSHSRDCPRKIVQCRFCVAAFPQIDLQSTDLDLPSDAASDADEGESVFWGLNIILTCLSRVGNFPLVSFLRSNLFGKNFGLPLFTIMCIALLVRRRGRQ